MNNLNSFGVRELNAKEVEETQGGGPIADLANWLKCGCNWPQGDIFVYA